MPRTRSGCWLLAAAALPTVLPGDCQHVALPLQVLASLGLLPPAIPIPIAVGSPSLSRQGNTPATQEQAHLLASSTFARFFPLRDLAGSVGQLVSLTGSSWRSADLRRGEVGWGEGVAGSLGWVAGEEAVPWVQPLAARCRCFPVVFSSLEALGAGEGAEPWGCTLCSL